MIEAVKSVARYTKRHHTSFLVCTVVWQPVYRGGYPPTGQAACCGFWLFCFFSLVSGGNRLVGMQGVHMYLGYIGYIGRLWRCICMCYIVYEGWILDGYIIDTSTLGRYTYCTYIHT